MPVKVCASYWDIQFSRSAQGIPGRAPLDSGGCPDSATNRESSTRPTTARRSSTAVSADLERRRAEQDALTYAVGKGVFISMSAGNATTPGTPRIIRPDTPRPLTARWPSHRSAGRCGTPTIPRSGSYVEIAAPGGDQLEGGLAGGIWQSTIRRADSDPETGIIFPRFDQFEETSSQGTSMASPHVAGMAALFYQPASARARRPRLVEQIIKKTARPCGAALVATIAPPTTCVSPPGGTIFFWCRPDSASSRLVRLGAQKVGAMRRMLLSIGLCAASLLSASLAAAQATQTRRRSWSLWSRRRCARSPRSTRRPWRR